MILKEYRHSQTGDRMTSSCWWCGLNTFPVDWELIFLYSRRFRNDLHDINSSGEYCPVRSQLIAACPLAAVNLLLPRTFDHSVTLGQLALSLVCSEFVNRILFSLFYCLLQGTGCGNPSQFIQLAVKSWKEHLMLIHRHSALLLSGASAQKWMNKSCKK